jgi:hypothetical protein
MEKFRRTFEIPGTTAMLGMLMLATAAGCQGNEDPDIEGSTQALQPKVVVCHRLRTITIAQPAVAAHLQHGDTLGACDDAGEDAGLDADASVDAGE